MALRLMIKLRHFTAGKRGAFSTERNALAPAALHRTADVIFRPGRASAAGALFFPEVGARSAVHAAIRDPFHIYSSDVSFFDN